MSIPVSSYAGAVAAYQRAASGDAAETSKAPLGAGSAFADLVKTAAEGAMATAEAGEAASVGGMQGGAHISEVVTAVADEEFASIGTEAIAAGMRADAAIVTDIPGTTRDALRERITLAALALTLVDTAGMRETGDPVEVEGVRRARDASGAADRVLWVADVRAGETAGIDAARAALGADAPVSVVVNKIDLSGDAPACYERDGVAVVRVSALTARDTSLTTPSTAPASAPGAASTG